MSVRAHGCWLGIALAFGLLTAWASADNVYWPQFRGPNGSGVNPDSHLPVEFGPETNRLWKTELPSGPSSPCVWRNSIFLTGFAEGRLETICLNRADGTILWRRAAPTERIEKTSGVGSPAASTPATDGERVYVYFGSFGLLCYDLAGQELWRHELPTPVTQHGTGTSPIVAGNRLILNCDQDIGSYLLAVEAKTGQTLWRTERPDYRRGFATPMLWRVAGQDWVVAPGTLRVAGYDLRTGARQWEVRGLPNEVCPSPVVGDGLLFVGAWTTGSGVNQMPDFALLLEQGDANHDGQLSHSEAPPGPARQHFLYIDANKDGQVTREEYESLAAIFQHSANALLAIRPSGQDDPAPPQIVWQQTRGLPYVPSPLYYRERVYLVKNGGLVSCFNATNGTPLYLEERLGALGDYYSSPVAADGKICVASQPGTVVVFEAGDRLKVLARNKLGEPIQATPAIVENKLYLRTKTALYAFGEN